MEINPNRGARHDTRRSSLARPVRHGVSLTRTHQTLPTLAFACLMGSFGTAWAQPDFQVETATLGCPDETDILDIQTTAVDSVTNPDILPGAIAAVAKRKLNSGSCWLLERWSALRFVRSAISGENLERDDNGAIYKKQSDRWLMKIPFREHGADARTIPVDQQGALVWVIPQMLGPPFTLALGDFEPQ